MRVLHVGAGNLYGGVERILVAVARQRPERHAFTVCFEGRLSRELRNAGAEVHHLGNVRFSRPLSVWRARRRLRGLLADAPADVVVGHSPWSYSLLSGAVESARVLWAHDALSGAHWTERAITRDTPSLVICNSRHTQDALDAWLPAGVPRRVLYAPVSVAASHGDERETVRCELGESADRVVIVIASRFERWKGHADLLKAAASVQGDWSIWMAGGAQRPDETELVESLKSLAAGLGIGNRVRFLGERNDVARILRASDVHCQPNSAPEPFGVAFVEALQAGLPVVTTAGGGASEIVTGTCGVLVPPGDTAALAAALQQLVADRTLRRRLGEAGPERALELCDAARQVATLDALLASLMAPGLAA